MPPRLLIGRNRALFNLSTRKSCGKAIPPNSPCHAALHFFPRAVGGPSRDLGGRCGAARPLPMYSATTHALSMREAQERFRGVIDQQAILPQSEPGAPPGTELWAPSVREPRPSATPRPLRTSARVRAGRSLGHVLQAPWPVNCHSENLERSELFVVLGTREEGIYIPLHHPCGLHWTGLGHRQPASPDR